MCVAGSPSESDAISRTRSCVLRPGDLLRLLEPSPPLHIMPSASPRQAAYSLSGSLIVSGCVDEAQRTPIRVSASSGSNQRRRNVNEGRLEVARACWVSRTWG